MTAIDSLAVLGVVIAIFLTCYFIYDLWKQKDL